MTVLKMIKRTIAVLVAAVFALNMSLISEAKTGVRYQLHKDGNWIAVGGRNEFSEVKATSREETKALENTLIQNDYILVTSEHMSILYEDYVKFRDSHIFWFSSYIVDEEPYWSTKKLYVYKPSYDDYMEQLNSGHGTERYTIEEINNSSVLIDYAVWDSIDAVGTISDVFNDNIPSYCKAGYLEIDSNINCEIKFLQAGTRRYYIFYVQKDNPFIIRLPIGCYHVVCVNNLGISDNIDNDGEDTLPYNNQIQIGEHHTIDNPYIIQLCELNEKYKLTDADISGKPDYSLLDDNEYYPIVEIAEESAVVSDDNQTSEKSSSDIILWILLISICVIGVVWVVANAVKSKKGGDNSE